LANVTFLNGTPLYILSFFLLSILFFVIEKVQKQAFENVTTLKLLQITNEPRSEAFGWFVV
ncbi:MAG: hypothetical protein WCI01_09965, partial [Chlorobiaceae bacterium]